MGYHPDCASSPAITGIEACLTIGEERWKFVLAINNVTSNREGLWKRGSPLVKVTKVDEPRTGSGPEGKRAKLHLSRGTSKFSHKRMGKSFTG